MVASYVPLKDGLKASSGQDQDLEDAASVQAHARSLASRQGLPRGWPRVLLILSALLICSCGLASLVLRRTSHDLFDTRSKVAYVTLLSIPPENAGKEVDIYEDNYFVATRLLGYQLMHDPQTRTRIGAPFIVMTTPGVHRDKIDRLKKDGAMVFEVTEPLDPKNYRSWEGSRFQDVYSKLFIWKWTQFDLVTFLDNDMLLNGPLDEMFRSPEVKLRQNLGNPEAIASDESPQPAEYVFAPISEDDRGPLHPNAGFFVAKPSLQMWDYFLSVFAVPGKFDPRYPEQNFMTHVFRQKGNMPWTYLDTKWSRHRPENLTRAQQHVAVHEKWWINTGDFHQKMDPALQKWMRAQRWKMEGFYTAMDAMSRR